MRTLVLGVGNPLMSDDGVGLRVLEALSGQQPALDDVDYLDAGTLSLLLLPRFEHCDALLVLDAAQLGGTPGDLRVLHGADMDAFFRNARGSVHEVGIRDLLDAARLTGTLPSRQGVRRRAAAAGGDRLVAQPVAAVRRLRRRPRTPARSSRRGSRTPAATSLAAAVAQVAAATYSFTAIHQGKLIRPWRTTPIPLARRRVGERRQGR